MTQSLTKEIDVERVKDLFDIDFERGLLIWKNPSYNRKRTIGMVAGYVSKDGYRRVCFDGKFHAVHRLIYAAYHGELSPDKIIDHKDGDKLNNCINNLHAVTHLYNSGHHLQHREGMKILGVSWNVFHNKWQAQMTANKKHYHLGLFKTQSEAYLIVREKYKSIRGVYPDLDQQFIKQLNIVLPIVE